MHVYNIQSGLKMHNRYKPRRNHLARRQMQDLAIKDLFWHNLAGSCRITLSGKVQNVLIEQSTSLIEEPNFVT